MDLRHWGSTTEVVMEGRVADVCDVEDVAAVALVDVASVQGSELRPLVRRAVLQDARGWRR